MLSVPLRGFKVTKKVAPWFFSVAFGTPKTRGHRPHPTFANVVAALRRKGLRSLQRFNQTWPKARYTHTFKSTTLSPFLERLLERFPPGTTPRVLHARSGAGEVSRQHARLVAGLESSIQEEHTSDDHSPATP